MKAMVVGLISVLAGIGIALVTVWWEFAGVVHQFEPNCRPAVLPRTTDGGVDAYAMAKAVLVGDPEFHFGTGQRNTTIKHVFTIKNEGKGPLSLEKGQSSCRCTVSELAAGQVPPGGKADVTLEVKLTTAGPKFRQTAEIRTNDPDRRVITLAVSGTITERVRIDPGELSLSRVSATEPTTARFRVYSYVTPDLQVVRHSLSHPDTASYYDLAFEPLSAEDLKGEAGATAGLLGKLTLKSGLPLGPINQTIRLVTNVPDSPEMELTVNGAVVGDISILGGNVYDYEQNIIRFGNVAHDVGAKADLRILVKGPHRRDVRFSIQEIDPQDVLTAKLSEPRELNNGAVYVYPLAVEIPKGSRTVNRLGYEQGKLARIVLATTHPIAKTVTLYVKFAVK
jgi:hypothetical protein